MNCVPPGSSQRTATFEGSGGTGAGAVALLHQPWRRSPIPGPSEAELEGAGVSANPWAKGGSREGPNRWSQTDETGTFALKGVDGGAYRVYAWKQGYRQEGEIHAKGGDGEVRVVLKKGEQPVAEPLEVPEPR